MGRILKGATLGRLVVSTVASALLIVSCQHVLSSNFSSLESDTVNLDPSFRTLENGEKEFTCLPGCPIEKTAYDGFPEWCSNVVETPVRACDISSKENCADYTASDTKFVCQSINFDKWQELGGEQSYFQTLHKQNADNTMEVVDVYGMSCKCLLPARRYKFVLDENSPPPPAWCFQYSNGCHLVGGLTTGTCRSPPKFDVSACTRVLGKQERLEDVE